MPQNQHQQLLTQSCQENATNGKMLMNSFNQWHLLDNLIISQYIPQMHNTKNMCCEIDMYSQKFEFKTRVWTRVDISHLLNIPPLWLKSLLKVEQVRLSHGNFGRGYEGFGLRKTQLNEQVSESWGLYAGSCSLCNSPNLSPHHRTSTLSLSTHNSCAIRPFPTWLNPWWLLEQCYSTITGTD